ncbi:MAG: hypothetical protein JNG88_06540 [Phycisphaerales bacterium]|nr:hypothetical protein [Phycisphaerales bacterium]
MTDMPEKKIDLALIPDNCDFRCPHSDFPPAETAGICRTMSAVHCRLLNELVNKNMPCEWRARTTGGKKRSATKVTRPRKRP